MTENVENCFSGLLFGKVTFKKQFNKSDYSLVINPGAPNSPDPENSYFMISQCCIKRKTEI